MESPRNETALRDRYLRRFEQPDALQQMAYGEFATVRLGAVAVGRTTYLPGWRWSTHVGRPLGQEWCSAEHIIFILSGAVAVALPDGSTTKFGAGDLFYIPPGEPHDAWVVGTEPYVSLHFLPA